MFVCDAEINTDDCDLRVDSDSGSSLNQAELEWRGMETDWLDLH